MVRCFLHHHYGLIIIIALGESLIVAASAVIGNERSPDLIVSSGFAVLLTCLLWWSYFAWTQEHIEEALLKEAGAVRARLGRDIYSFLHFPLVCGIIGIAIGFEKILGHPLNYHCHRKTHRYYSKRHGRVVSNTQENAHHRCDENNQPSHENNSG